MGEAWFGRETTHWFGAGRVWGAVGTGPSQGSAPWPPQSSPPSSLPPVALAMPTEALCHVLSIPGCSVLAQASRRPGHRAGSAASGGWWARALPMPLLQCKGPVGRVPRVSSSLKAVLYSENIGDFWAGVLPVTAMADAPLKASLCCEWAKACEGECTGEGLSPEPVSSPASSRTELSPAWGQEHPWEPEGQGGRRWGSPVLQEPLLWPGGLRISR